jgi:hypothetical protein
MLKSIQELKCIGCFYDDHPAPIRFEPLTFIFGDNCYGKSTLCDIFRSLSDNTPEYITDRISVPNPQNQRQSVSLSIALPDNDAETQFVFRQNQWNPPLPENLKLFVFDTDFIHRNVFTGLTIERKNKENITQFVLGEAGVRTAKDIQDQNSNLRSIKKSVRQLIENTFKGIDDIPKFVLMNVEETEDQLLEEIGKKANVLQTKTELEANIEKVKERNNLTLLPIPEDIDDYIEKVNTCLASSYQIAHDDASNAVEEHIKNKTQNTITTKSWLKSGLNQVAGDDCPFCGNPLNEPGKALIEIYKTCFDDAFKNFETNTNTQLRQIPGLLENFRCLNIPVLLQENIANLTLYPELTESNGFKKRSKLINASAKGLRNIWVNFQTQYNVFSENLNDKIGQKKESIYSECPLWDCADLAATFDNFKLSATKYNELTSQVIDQITNFKESLNPDTIAAEITAIKNEQTVLQLKKRRLDTNEACVTLAGLYHESNQTDQKIAGLKAQLAREQTDFLDTCFAGINDLFRRLGSGSFENGGQVCS